MPVLTRELRNAVLQAAMEGNLVEQRLAEGSGEELYQQIQTEKQKLIKAGTIKKEKPLPKIMENEKAFDIPKSWKWVRLLDVIKEKPSNGFSPKGVDYETPVRNLTLTATTSGYFKADAFKYVDISPATASKHWLNNNDLLIQRSNSRELVGTSCIYTGEEKKYIYPDLMMKMKAMVDVRYLDFIMKAPVVRNYFMKSASGTSESMPKINQNIVTCTLIPLPPLAEQKRIVKKIDELMAKIDEYEVIEKELEALKRAFPREMKEALLQAAMQGNLTNADLEKWEYKTLDKATVLYTGNSISESVKKAKYEGVAEGYDYIGTKDVGFDHHIDYDNGVRIPYDQSGFKYAEKDATLLCIEGGSAGKKIGKLDRKVCFGNKLCAFHPVGEDADYLHYFLQSPLFTKVFKEGVSGIIGGVSINKLKDMEMPIPPFEDQQRIVEKLDLFLPLCDELAELA